MAALVSAALIGAPLPALSQVGDQGHHSGYAAYVNVNDLVGARAAGAESDLQARGFRNTSGYKANDRAHTYWWNGNTRQCNNTAVYDGRIELIQSTAESYCQK